MVKNIQTFDLKFLKFIPSIVQTYPLTLCLNDLVPNKFPDSLMFFPDGMENAGTFDFFAGGILNGIFICSISVTKCPAF